MTVAFLALGSNIEPEKNLLEAVRSFPQSQDTEGVKGLSHEAVAAKTPARILQLRPKN